jgi:hypothetical protein
MFGKNENTKLTEENMALKERIEQLEQQLHEQEKFLSIKNTIIETLISTTVISNTLVESTKEIKMSVFQAASNLEELSATTEETSEVQKQFHH